MSFVVNGFSNVLSWSVGQSFGASDNLSQGSRVASESAADVPLKETQPLQIKNVLFPYNGWPHLPKPHQESADQGRAWMAERLQGMSHAVTTDDQREIDTVYIQSIIPTNKVAVLFHGNGMIAGSMVFYANYFHQLGFQVVLCTMGGYPGSQGDTSESTCYFDVKAMYDTAKQIQHENGGEDNSKILFFGTSLGAALATIGGSEFPGTHVLAHVPFATAKDAGGSQLRWGFQWIGKGYIRSLIPKGIKAGEYVTDCFDSWEKVKRIIGGYFAIQAENDTIMPADSSKRLAEAYAFSHHSKPEDHYTLMKGKGHGDIFVNFQGKEYDEATRLRVESYLASIGLI